MAKNKHEIVIELSGFSMSPTQHKAIAETVKGAVVQGLSTGQKDGVLVRPTVVSGNNIKIGIARVINGGNM